MPPPEGQNSPPKKTRPNFQTNQGPRVIWVSCNIYIILYAHFSGYPNFSGGMSWKSPHISRPFFVQAYEAVDQVDFWEELLGERRGKMTCFLIPNLFGEVVEESLRKRYWYQFFDPIFFGWFPNDSFLTHVFWKIIAREWILDIDDECRQVEFEVPLSAWLTCMGCHPQLV